MNHLLKSSTGELSRQLEEKESALSQIHRVKNAGNQQIEELKRLFDEEMKVRRFHIPSHDLMLIFLLVLLYSISVD